MDGDQADEMHMRAGEDGLRRRLEEAQAERDAARAQYASLCIGDPYSGDAFVGPWPAVASLDMRDKLARLTKERDQLRADLAAADGLILNLREGSEFAAERAADAEAQLRRLLAVERERVDRLRAQIRRMCGPSMTTAELERALGLEPGDLGEEADRG